ncbi:hypothetical protein GOV04_02705 [Candidatus Woesearchaeota archaeon]|nr:hypothetical protein [Candidatus Woesearchaeota archaeon]
MKIGENNKMRTPKDMTITSFPGPYTTLKPLDVSVVYEGEGFGYIATSKQLEHFILGVGKDAQDARDDLASQLSELFNDLEGNERYLDNFKSSLLGILRNYMAREE